MACYHPLNAYIDGINPKTGKNILKFLPKVSDGTLHQCNIKHTDLIKIPCGKCIGCRLEYSRQWADRCMIEASYHKDNIFITLTYNNDNLPEPMEGSEIHPLKKEHLQKFFKDLRQSLFYEYTINHPRAKYFYNPKKGSNWRSVFRETCPKAYSEYCENMPRIRYYACGEYSPVSFDGSGMRPHFHAIIFGYKPVDITLFKRDIKNGWLYFTSEKIKKLWPYGFHIITDVTWETCAYTARYIMKKQYGAGSVVYDEKKYPKEFTLMSRKPGIAARFFEEHPDIIEKEYYIPTRDGSKKLRSNKYFDKLFDLYYPEYYTDIKDIRKEAIVNREKLLSENSSYSYSERLINEEHNKLEQTRTLKRKEKFV